MEKKGFEARMNEFRGDGRREWWCWKWVVSWRDQEKVMNMEEIDEVEAEETTRWDDSSLA